MNTPAPKVSVIIPTCNRASLLLRAIESVCRQTVRELEILVVDDGSTDGTPELVRQLADERIRLLAHAKSRGAPAARNTGIDAARGEWIAFLDDDDLWFPCKTERQLGVCDGCVGVVGGYRLRYAGAARILKRNEVGLQELRKRNHFGVCFIVQAGLAKELRFDESLPKGQDWDFLMRLIARGRVANVPEVLMELNDGAHTRISNRGRGQTIDELLVRGAATRKHAHTLGPYWTDYRMAFELTGFIAQDSRALARIMNVAGRHGWRATAHVLMDKLFRRITSRVW